VEVVDRAVEELFDEFQEVAPTLAGAVKTWCGTAYSDPLSDSFLAPDAFPLLLFPWLFEGRYRSACDRMLQKAIAKSSIAGYLAIRLIDNVADENAVEERRLLSAVPFLSVQFSEGYRSMLGADSEFHRRCNAAWGKTAEAAHRDVYLRTVSELEFLKTSTYKTHAGTIPITALARVHALEDHLDLWLRVHDLFARWHQFLDDVRDWEADLSEGRSTYFLCEMRRHRHPSESRTSWATLDGFEWAMNTLDGWMRQMMAIATQIGSDELLGYLKFRSDRLTARGVKEALR
jgi:hypothetical protein